MHKSKCFKEFVACSATLRASEFGSPSGTPAMQTIPVYGALHILPVIQQATHAVAAAVCGRLGLKLLSNRSASMPTLLTVASLHFCAPFEHFITL